MSHHVFLLVQSFNLCNDTCNRKGTDLRSSLLYTEKLQSTDVVLFPFLILYTSILFPALWYSKPMETSQSMPESFRNYWMSLATPIPFDSYRYFVQPSESPGVTAHLLLNIYAAGSKYRTSNVIWMRIFILVLEVSSEQLVCVFQYRYCCTSSWLLL